MGVRWRMVLGTSVSLLLIASCGDGSESTTSTTSRSSVSTVSLPLQPSGLAVGGDVQSRATDVLRRGITKEQAQRIADACRPAAEIANSSNHCTETIIRIIVLVIIDNEPLSCEGKLCISVYDVSKLRQLGYDGYVEITDDRPEKSLCDTTPGNVCLRVGLATSALLDQVVAATLPTTSSEVTTSSEATTSTETTPTDTSDTSSSTPETTSAPTASS